MSDILKLKHYETTYEKNLYVDLNLACKKLNSKQFFFMYERNFQIYVSNGEKEHAGM